MHDRYTRNIGALTETEQELLLTKRAAIAGCGGLGCYAVENLARIGLGHLTLIDGDTFAPQNLNRQLYSLETNIGKSKAAEAKKRLGEVRADLSVQVFDVFLNEENAAELLKGHDVIIDALDNVKTRLLLEKAANELRIPLVHGAVEQWSAQVCVVYPGDFTLSSLYEANREFERPSVLSFAPAFCATLQAAEAVKVKLNKESVLRKKLFTADLKNCTFDIVEL
jgi:molybdopterin/thiamine biosynthesis adenylyltransferase